MLKINTTEKPIMLYYQYVKQISKILFLQEKMIKDLKIHKKMCNDTWRAWKMKNLKLILLSVIRPACLSLLSLLQINTFIDVFSQNIVKTTKRWIMKIYLEFLAFRSWQHPRTWPLKFFFNKHLKVVRYNMDIKSS